MLGLFDFKGREHLGDIINEEQKRLSQMTYKVTIGKRGKGTGKYLYRQCTRVRKRSPAEKTVTSRLNTSCVRNYENNINPN